MSTLNEMVDEIKSNLQGYTLRQDRISYVANPAGLTTTSSAITIGSASNLAKGTIEIDDELIWIDSFDKATNVLNVIPGFGRGYQGTAPAPHSTNAQVTLAPTFPRVSIKKAINDTIRAVGTQLMVVKQTTFTFNAAISTYDLSNLDIQSILTVMWQSVGPSLEWIRVNRYDFDPFAESTYWGGDSQTITIRDHITPGRTVKIMYVTQPEVFSSNSQTFTTQTGYPESVRDVIIVGAAYRLLAYLDPARASQISPQADEIDAKRPFGSSNNATRQLFALYQQRLREEISAFQGQYPPRIRFNR